MRVAARPWDVYDLLLDLAHGDANDDNGVEEVLIGNVWTLCQCGHEVPGLAMSPAAAQRTLAWSGSLKGRPARELATWVRSWNAYEAAVGMAVINALINSRPNISAVATELNPTGPANLGVFEHFLPRLRDKKVVVIGHYPGIEHYRDQLDMTVLERQPGDGDLPDTACEYLLPDADWVFLTASSLCNKTFPRLAELSLGAVLVLMGPTSPWIADLAAFGVDYIAGVTVTDREALRRTVAEGGGMRIFDSGVRYRIVALDSANEQGGETDKIQSR